MIYTAFGNEAYFKITGKLKASGIPYKSITPLSGFRTQSTSFKDMTQYDIYVKKDDEHLAREIVQECARIN
ncbi:MAG TPA: hypothetical protein VFH42_04805 [Sporolactobacillaceae bacterium]|nr:hypothetical protein [Sporolactobacillaceae bacterium]